MRTPEEILDAYGRFLMPDGEEDMDTAVKTIGHGSMGLVAARNTSEPDMRVYSWLEEALGSREPYDLYQEITATGAPVRGVTIDPGTELLVIVDAGHLMCVRLGDWVVYVPDRGFSVMPDKVFRAAWECMR